MNSISANDGTRYLAKAGMILLKVTDPVLMKTFEDAWGTDDSRCKYYELIVDLHKEIEDVLCKCSDIKNVKRHGELRMEHFEPFDHYNSEENDYFLQESSSFLSFDLFLPKSERKYAFDVRYEENVIEKAHIIYNGMFFLAFAEIDDDSSTSMFGQEIREFLNSKLISNRWQGVTVPPCPLHPEIILTITNEVDKLDVSCNEYNDI